MLTSSDRLDDTHYTYNADDSIANVKNSANTLDLLGKTQKYDADGNLTDDGCSKITYTGFEQTQSVTPKPRGEVLDSLCNTSTMTYGYDALGRQVARGSTPAGPNPLTPGTLTSTQLFYAGASSNAVGEVSSGGSTTTLDYTLSSLGGSLAVTSTGSGAATQYLVDDGTGSVGVTTSSSGGAGCILHYTPAGEATADNTAVVKKPTDNPCSSGSTVSDKQYRGERRDDQTGTYQLGARTYSPGRAAFSSPDTAGGAGAGGASSPMTDPLTANGYGYVNGDPINLSDPSGHRTDPQYYGKGGSARIENDACDYSCYMQQINFLNEQAKEAAAKAKQGNCISGFGFFCGVYGGAKDLGSSVINVAEDPGQLLNVVKHPIKTAEAFGKTFVDDGGGCFDQSGDSCGRLFDDIFTTAVGAGGVVKLGKAAVALKASRALKAVQVADAVDALGVADRTAAATSKTAAVVDAADATGSTADVTASGGDAATADGAAGGSTRPVSARNRYMGRTPSKYSRTGGEVVDRMRDEGLISGEGPLLPGNPNGLMLSTDAGLVPIDATIDMAHVTDAVTWWNSAGRFFGAKSFEVRSFMLNSDNYKLLPRSINRSEGASLGQTYLPPAAPDFGGPAQ